MRKKGFTLIEIIITIALIPIIVGVAYQLFSFGLNSYRMSQNEYELQSNMRMAVEKTNEVIKYSTSIFVIPKNSFRDDNLDDEWDYIGISDDKKEIVQYISDGKGNKHKKNIIVPTQENIKFEVRFVKANPNKDDNLLKMIFVGINQITGNEIMQIETQLTAVNSGFVKDYGSVANPGVAIAYRHDMLISEVPKNENIATLTFVMDVSGSMANKLSTSHPNQNTRIKLLKDASSQMIDDFAKEEDLDFRITLIPFSTSANYPNPRNANSNENHPTYDIKNSTLIESQINGLNAIGGTNTGDGLRRAYHNTDNLKTILVNENKNPINYLIVLVDGVSTFASVTYISPTNSRSENNHTWFTSTNPTSYTLQTNSSHVSNSGRNGVVGKGNALDDIATEYVNTIGGMITSNKLYEQVYVIGFSGIAAEMESVNDIAKALGIANPETSKYVYDFSKNTNLDLSEVLDEIRQDIIQQIWRVDGPKY